MIATLQEMIAPLTEDALQAALRDRTLILQRGTDPTRFECLLDWPTLRGLIESNAIPPAKYKLTYKTRAVSPDFYLSKKKVVAENLAGLFRQGVSLVTDPIDQHVATLGALCRDVGTRTASHCIADVIVTTGQGGAFATHYDPFDLVALQVHGSKRWLVYGPPVVDPVPGMAERKPPEGEPLLDEVLHAGDLLVMPGGYWHRCENTAELSLHISIGIRAPTGWHASKTLSKLLLEDELFRRPLTRFADVAERDAHEAALKARLIETIGQISLPELAAAALKRRSERP